MKLLRICGRCIMAEVVLNWKGDVFQRGMRTMGYTLQAATAHGMANTARIVSGKDAAKRVGERINAGRFGTELENVEAAAFVRRQVASRLIEMYRESFAGENGYRP